MNKQVLTRQECNALRGLAILGIVLHNYCHWLGPIVKENEYQYFQNRIDAFNVALSHPDQNFFMHLMSFFGHYGVPIFLFLSAYGLVMKYERKPDVTINSNSSTSVIQFKLRSIWEFIRYHYLKLFKMMIVGFVAFTMVDAITSGRFHYNNKIVFEIFMFNNIFPQPHRYIWPGPYWFFGLMLQLYIVYRLFLYRRHWGFTVGFIIICEIIQLFCNPEGQALNWWRYNFFGSMLPFGMGLLTARHGEPFSYQLSAIVILPSIFMVYYFSNGFFYWTLVPLAIIFTSICFIKILQPRSKNIISSLLSSIYQFLQWVGNISAALFVCHPITRKIFINAYRQENMYTGLLFYIITSICLALFFNELMKYIPNPTQKNPS